MLTQHMRSKRATDDIFELGDRLTEKLKSEQQKMQAQFGNASCVLQELDIVDQNLEIDVTFDLEGGEPREFLLALAFSLDLVEADFFTTAAPSFFDLGFLASVLDLAFLAVFFTSAFSPNLYLLLFLPSSRAFLKIPFSTPFFRAKERYIAALLSSPTSWTSLICLRIAVLEHPVLSFSSLIASIIPM